MEPFKYHVYVCNQKKPEGVPSCSAHGSDKLIDCLRREIMRRGLGDAVQVTTCGSIGLCERGPNMVVYPEGIWYSGVTLDDIPQIVSEHFQSGRIVERLANHDAAAVKGEIETNKGRMMAAFKAHDAAGALPDDFRQQIRAFQASRVILSAVELDVFTAIGQKASAEEVAGSLGIDARAAAMLLNALVALDLLEKKDDLFFNTALTTRYLTDNSPDDSRAALMHSVHLWGRWSTLTDCIKKGSSVTYKESSERPAEWTEAFIAAMHKNASLGASQVVRAIGINDVKKVLDVGGGSGAYSIAFARANSNLKAEVFDLPNVVPIAQKHIQEAGLSDRVTTRVGDFRRDEFGQSYDLVFISAICHMNGPKENAALLQKAFAALSAGGRVVVQDFILRPDKTSPLTAALFALNMLVGTRSGSAYSETEYTEWLKAAGFRDVRLLRMPGPAALMLAHR
jgi:(2Fe-2S) ferredoxin/cyclopropane fatty-acyl-phospholipid synthase-like methyltransferase